MGSATRIVALLLVIAGLAGLAMWIARQDAPEEPSTSPERETGASREGQSSERADARPREHDSPEPSPAGALEIVVLDPWGRAAAGARLRVEREWGAIAEGVVDDKGRWRLEAPGGRGVIVVVASGAAPHRHPSSLEPGSVEIRLPLGAEVSGTVLVDGAPPREPLVLRIWDRHPSPSPGRPEPGIRVETLADGSFRFTGLPHGWPCGLSAPDAFEFDSPAGSRRFLDLTTPSTDLEIRLRRHPSIAGRILQPDREGPAPRVLVGLRYRHGSGGGGALTTRTDENGSFLFALRRGVLRASTLLVEAHGRRASASVAIDPARLDPHLDLGDIVLIPMRTLAIVARGPTGRPVPGAVALWGRWGRRRSAPTDADGRTVLDLRHDTESFRVAGPGTRIVVVRVPPPGAAEPLVVTLLPAPWLTVMIRAAADAPARSVRLRVTADTELFTGPGGALDLVLVEAGADEPFVLETGDSGTQARYDPGVDGEVRLGRVRADVPVLLEVLDLMSQEVLVSRRVTVRAVETKVVTMVVDAPTRPLVGVVRSAVGGALPAATVRLGSIETKADREGRFRLDGVRERRFRLEVSHRGFVSRVEPDYQPPADAREVEFVLSPGRSVQLRVVDASGRPVRAEEVGVDGPDLGLDGTASEREPGLWTLLDLPGGRIRLYAIVAGRRFVVEHESSHLRASLVVPAPGAVHVSGPWPDGRPRSAFVRLAPVDDTGAEVTASVQAEPDRTGWRVEIPAVLPGRYAVRLEARRDSDGEERSHELLLVGPPVVVVSRSTVDVDLRR